MTTRFTINDRPVHPAIGAVLAALVLAAIPGVWLVGAVTLLVLAGRAVL